MRTVAAALLMSTICGLVHADEIYGTLVKDGKPLGKTEIKITCDGEDYEGSTNEGGSYGIYVEKTGSCTFTLTASGASVPISSYDDPAKYDFEVVGGQLQRR